MIKNDFAAAITDEDFWEGEARHQRANQSRKLAMAAGLTKSSEELKQAWEDDPELFLLTLSGALAAYDEYENVRELLVGSISRLVSVVDAGGDAEMTNNIVSRAMEIIAKENIADQ